MKCLSLVAGLVLAGGLCSNAQTSLRQAANDSLLSDHKVISLTSGSEEKPTAELREKMEQFYYNSYRSFQDPAAPYFMFMSRDGKLVMGLGGTMKLRAYFDPGNSMPSDNFNPYDIPMSATPLNRNHLGTTAAGSQLYFLLLGENGSIGKYQVYIRGKFNGEGGKGFKLNKAYATLGDWTLGLATSTFADGDAEAPTVDNNGTTMSMDRSAILVRYQHSFKKSGVKVGASVETADMSLDTDGTQTAARAISMPNFAAMLQWEWAKGEHIQLAGIMRSLPYRDLVNGRNHSPLGWGLQLSTVFNLTPALTFYGMANTGRSYTNTDSNFLLGPYDLMPEAGDPGKLKTVATYSYYLGLSYHFSHKCFASCTFGQGRNFDTSGRMGDAYKYGLYGDLNVFYNLTPRIMFGAGAGFGKRSDLDGAHRYARRIGAIAQFSF